MQTVSSCRQNAHGTATISGASCAMLCLFDVGAEAALHVTMGPQGLFDVAW